MIVVYVTVAGAKAQQPFFANNGSRGGGAGRFIEPDRSLRQDIGDAKLAIEEKRFGDAVITLGELLARNQSPGLSELQGQDFFYAGDQPRLFNRSVLKEAEEILGQLPSSGYEIYQLRYGSTARAELDEAIGDRDWYGIAKISRQYLHTDAGYEATLLLGYREMSLGDPLAAALILKRLYSHPRPKQKFAEKLAAFLAGCWYQAGHDDRAVNVLLSATGGQDLSLDGRLVELPATGTARGELVAWLAQHFPRQNRSTLDDEPDKAIAGGGVNRIGYGGGELPMRNIRWKVPTTWSSRDESFLQDFEYRRGSTGQLPIPSWQPIVVGDTVLAKTTEAMVAINYETGKRVWVYPWSVDGPESSKLSVTEVADDNKRQQLLVQRVWNDLPFGRVSSDGKRVYMLDGLTEIEPANFSTFGRLGVQGIQQSDDGANSLVALDIATEGKLVWEIGGEDASEPELDEAFFLGPPLPVDGHLYVIAEQKGDIFLLCLQPTTGRLVWRQHLVAIEGASIENDAIRRIGGAMPAYSDGVLVCPTGHGAVVGFDLATRTFRWGYTYPRTSTQSNRSFSSRRGTSDISTLLNRWHDGTPMISRGRVLVTPVEGNRMYAIDLMTGQPLWPTIDRESWMYLAGVHDETAVLVGSNGAMGISMVNGTRRWAYDLSSASSGSISGRGVFADGQFLVPTSQNKIVSIDLESGRQNEIQQVNFVLGNLVSVRGELLSHSATEIAIARGIDTLSQTVESALAVNPNDYKASLRKGELLMQAGHRDEALVWLKRAYDREPEDEEVRVLLVEAMLDGMRDESEFDDETTSLVEKLAEMPDERNEFLRLMAVSALNRKDHTDAIDYLLKLSRPLVNRSGRSQREPMIELGDRTTSLDGWLRARVGEIVEAADDTQLEAINERIGSEVADLQAVGADTRTFLARFGAFSSTDPLRIALATRFQQEGSLLRVERLLIDGLDTARSQRSRDKWHAMLALLYYRMGWNADANDQLAKVESIADLDLAKYAFADLLSAKKEQAKAIAPTLWPKFVKVESASQTSPGEAIVSVEALQVIGRRGKSLRDWNIMLGKGSDALQFQDPRGIVSQMLSIDSVNSNQTGPKQVRIDRGVMIVVLPSTMMAIDLFRAGGNRSDMDLWDQAWRGSVRHDIAASGMTNDFGQKITRFQSQSLPAIRLASIQNGQCVALRSMTLSSIDVMTGKNVWSNNIEVRDGYVVSGPSTVSVISPSSRIVRLFNAHDGKPIAQHQWLREGEVIWASSGNNVLSYTHEKESGKSTGTLALRLWDASTGEDILQREKLRRGVKGEVKEDRWLTLLQDSGELEVWDLASGQVHIKDQLPIDKPLEGVHMLVWNDKMVVLPNVKQEPNEKLRLDRAQGPQHVEVAGPAMAYDLETGEPRWAKPLEVGEYGVTLHQPNGGPLLFLSRRQKPLARPNKIPTWSFSVVAIDVRTGVIADITGDLRAATVPSQVLTNVRIDLDKREYTVDIQRNTLKYTFQDDPAPEKPQIPEQSIDDGAQLDGGGNRQEPFGFFQPVE